MVISDSSRMCFRLLMFAFFTTAVVLSAYAPNKAPKLPEGVSFLSLLLFLFYIQFGLRVNFVHIYSNWHLLLLSASSSFPRFLLLFQYLFRFIPLISFYFFACIYCNLNYLSCTMTKHCIYSVLPVWRCDRYDRGMHVPLATQGTNNLQLEYTNMIFVNGSFFLRPQLSYFGLTLVYCVTTRPCIIYPHSFLAHNLCIKLLKIQDGCIGSQCQYQMGLSFYHHSCKDCKCVQEPSR